MTVLETYFMSMAADMDRAVRFYEDAFGSPIGCRPHGDTTSSSGKGFPSPLGPHSTS